MKKVSTGFFAGLVALAAAVAMVATSAPASAASGRDQGSSRTTEQYHESRETNGDHERVVRTYTSRGQNVSTHIVQVHSSTERASRGLSQVRTSHVHTSHTSRGHTSYGLEVRWKKKDVLRAVLTGAQEVPGPGDPDGRGGFVAIADEKKLCYVLGVEKIARPTAAHIHAGRQGVAGPVVVTLKTPSKGGSAGCIEPVANSADSTETLSQRESKAILAHPEKYYVNVHNAPFPDGAIRGQLH